MHKLRKASVTPQRTKPNFIKKNSKNFAQPTQSSKQKSARLEKETSAKQIIGMNQQGRIDALLYPYEKASSHTKLIPRGRSALLEKTVNQNIYETKMKEKLGKSTVVVKAAKKFTKI